MHIIAIIVSYMYINYCSEWDVVVCRYGGHIILGQKYSTPAEEARRQTIFKTKLQTILSHNYIYRKGIKSYHMGLNHLTDWVYTKIVYLILV